MKVVLDFDGKTFNDADVKITAVTKKDSKKKDKNEISHSGKVSDVQENLDFLKAGKAFKGNKDESVSFDAENGEKVLVWGLGDKTKLTDEDLRKAISKAFKEAKSFKASTIGIDMDSLPVMTDIKKTFQIVHEAIGMTEYSFDKYLSDKKPSSLKSVTLFSSDKKNKKAIETSISESENLVSSIHYMRDLVNEAPNVLNSVSYAKMIEKDVKETFKGKNVKVKVLTKAELKKENMDLFLSVNAGSAHDARLVHLTYTPKKAAKNAKHYALVGKGLTFDTGGYSLKPGASMMGMKFDMGGSATVYGAFRAAALNDAPVKITCILGMTDNMVNEHATVPDSIVKSRSGKTVEILNTDAEGRLVLADCLDYACDQKPDFIIDAATLTGACLVALGSEVCAVLGNNEKFIEKVKASASATNEYMWQLPIIPEWRDDMKSKVADLKNIGTPMRAGTATAAAFLENFIKNDIAWAHLDIAGVCDSQGHLPYCPPKGASGLIVRTLHHLLVNGK